MEEDEYSVDLDKAIQTIVSTMTFHQRLGSSRSLKRMYDNYGWCFRCQCPWPVVQIRSVQYDELHGCFAICTTCWAELGNAKERIPYYMALVKQWDEDNCVEEDLQELMDKIAAAVVTASLEEMEGAKDTQTGNATTEASVDEVSVEMRKL